MPTIRSRNVSLTRSLARLALEEYVAAASISERMNVRMNGEPGFSFRYCGRGLILICTGRRAWTENSIHLNLAAMRSRAPRNRTATVAHVHAAPEPPSSARATLIAK